MGTLWVGDPRKSDRRRIDEKVRRNNKIYVKGRYRIIHIVLAIYRDE